MSTTPAASAPAGAAPRREDTPRNDADLLWEQRPQWIAAFTAARRRQIERLYRYVGLGEFPENHLVLGETPVFVDRRGVPCAVAYLMIQSGWQKVVDQVVAADNHVRISGLNYRTPVMQWIARSGLLQLECADIQPTYGFREERREVRLMKHFNQVAANLERDFNWAVDEAVSWFWQEIADGAKIEELIQ